ncbi:MAG: hypothetical protein ACJAT4_002380 [Granulosicoccus sp.]|jgi:hypothetical protein
MVLKMNLLKIRKMKKKGIEVISKETIPNMVLNILMGTSEPKVIKTSKIK